MRGPHSGPGTNEEGVATMKTLTISIAVAALLVLGASQALAHPSHITMVGQAPDNNHLKLVVT